MATGSRLTFNGHTRALSVKLAKQRGEDGHVGPQASKIQKSSVLWNALSLSHSHSGSLT